MLRSIATVSLSGNLKEKIEAIAAAHFDAVEIFENDLLFYQGSATEIQSVAGNLGLQICLFQPFRDFEAVSPNQFHRNLDRAERKFELMHGLGTSLLLVCSNVSKNAENDDELASSQLYELAERAAKHGFRIGYEALAWGTHVRTLRHAWQIVQRAAHPHLGLILDSFHTLALDDEFTAIEEIPPERIFLVQLADAPRLSMGVLPWSRHFRCFPGQGDLPVAEFLAAVLQTGYVGPISLEIFNDDFRGVPPRPNAIDGMRSLLWLEEQARALLTQEPGGKPTKRVVLFDPPPAPFFHGFAFLEFAVEHTSERDLASWLQGLGFCRVGRHRTKDVLLYRQGEINAVLNAEPDSFAHGFYSIHGQSICAIALKVTDDLEALSRAQAFLCTRFDGRVGPNERTIPAVKSPDESLIYFVSFDEKSGTPLETDFIVDEPGDERSTSLGLKRIDHVAYALPPEQFGSWILFYRAVLGFVPDDLWEIPDPHGIVRSRVVAAPDRSVSFALNISESRNTATGRSISRFGGAGVHHIALATENICETAAKLVKRGVSLLRIPKNYYLDLESRFELTRDQLEELRVNNILYDRSDSGEFFHAYTDFVEDRFYFEIIERRGDYRGFGAINAPVRLAAQAEMYRRALEDSDESY
ncbi:MAG: sugar phosphate isomerase/epimerase and 4-hydroxyphenylpyruvate domain-containing protein [Verrucomicrobia bacterium]|nr:sugar phosphate isomerase/epimerase and 4-hydroxyphenylpyruvate domain-containing protein [Verrucomicrobiota bacterium]